MSAEALQWISMTSAAILAAAGVAALLWRLFKAAVDEAIGTRIDRIARAQEEQDADFHTAIGQISVRLDAVVRSLDDVRSQVYPNSGSSLRDRVDELHALLSS